MSEQNTISAAQMKQMLHISRLLTVTADLDILLLRIVEAACAILNCERASIFLHDPKTNELWTKIALQVREIRVPSSAGIVGAAFTTNKLILVPEPYKDPRFNPEPDRKNNFITRNLLTAPMPNMEGRPVGAIQAVNKRGGPFESTDEGLIELLADQAGVAIQRYNLQREAVEAMALRREMDLAKLVQMALIPDTAPAIPGVQVAGYTKAASITGGDAYDLWQTSDGRLGIFLGDATGHGIGPALVVSQARTMIRAMCEIHSNPRQLLACANARLNEDLDSGKFVTAFLGFISSDGKLEWCSAGHGPIFVRSNANEPLRPLEPCAPPLGVMAEFLDDPAEPVQLNAGGLVCISSDGIFEAFSPTGEQFGDDRLTAILTNTNGSPEGIIQSVQSAVRQWQGNDEPKDDQTMVIAIRG